MKTGKITKHHVDIISISGTINLWIHVSDSKKENYEE